MHLDGKVTIAQNFYADLLYTFISDFSPNLKRLIVNYSFGNIIMIYLLLLVNTDNSCTSSRTFRGIKVSYVIPFINNDASLTIDKNSYEVYYNDDLIIYNFSYVFDSSENNKNLLTEERNYYFIFDKDSAFGYNFYPYPHEPFPDGRLSVDSMLYLNTYVNNRFDSLFDINPDSCFAERNGDSIIIYKNVFPDQTEEFFSISLTYKKKNFWMKETFARKIDSKKDMKLSQIKVIASGGYIKEAKMSVPKRQYIYEMSEIPKKEAKERYRSLETYKKEYLKLIAR